MRGKICRIVLLWRFDPDAGRRVAHDHQFVAKLPGLPRGQFDAELGGDPAEDDGPYPTALELGIEVGAEKRAPGGFGDLEIAGLGQAGREIAEARGQGVGQPRGRVDGSRFIHLGGHVDQDDRRALGAKPPGERLARFDELVRRERLELAAEDPVLQVDQHEGGRLGVEGDHRRAPERGRLRGKDL